MCNAEFPGGSAQRGFRKAYHQTVDFYKRRKVAFFGIIGLCLLLVAIPIGLALRKKHRRRNNKARNG